MDSIIYGDSKDEFPVIKSDEYDSELIEMLIEIHEKNNV